LVVMLHCKPLQNILKPSHSCYTAAQVRECGSMSCASFRLSVICGRPASGLVCCLRGYSSLPIAARLKADTVCSTRH
jgi:hypothetical protein